MYKYEMIAEEIQKKIKDGTYPPDTTIVDVLPTGSFLK